MLQSRLQPYINKRQNDHQQSWQVLDLSATCMHSYELQRVLRALGQRGARSRLAVFHPPIMLSMSELDDDEGNIDDYGEVHAELARLPRLTEVGLGFVWGPCRFVAAAKRKKGTRRASRSANVNVDANVDETILLVLFLKRFITRLAPRARSSRPSCTSPSPTPRQPAA